MPVSRRFAVCLVLLAAVSSQVRAQIPDTERAALLALYAATDGDNWVFRDGWNGAPGTECTWEGITCSADGASVIYVQLTAHHLSGELPALDSLLNLRTLDFSYNQLTGPLPSLAALTQLLTIDVSNNQLSGQIPAFPLAPSLWVLRFQDNHFSGAIPSLAGLGQLKFLNLTNNQLSGPIPDWSGSPLLVDVDLSRNGTLSGTIPPLQGLANLRNLFLDGNQLTGGIPLLDGLDNLQQITLSSNLLAGPVPAIANLPRLQWFFVGYNRLNGSVGEPQSSLRVGSLCPNQLAATPSAAWDAITHMAPWYSQCDTDGVFQYGFDF